MRLFLLLIVLGTTITFACAARRRNLDDFWGITARAQSKKTTTKGNVGSASTTASSSCATATNRSVRTDLYNVVVQPQLFKQHVRAIRPQIEKSCTKNQIVDWDTWTRKPQYYTGHFSDDTVKIIKKTVGFLAIEKLFEKRTTNGTMQGNTKGRRSRRSRANSNDSIITLDKRLTQTIQKDATWNLAHISLDQATPIDLSIGGYLGGSGDGLSDDWRYVYPSSAGAGVTIYLMDTGTRDHPDFEDRVIAWSVVEDSAISIDQEDDSEGHATHMASLAAGKSFGVAKKAKISSIKVEDDGGGTALADQQGLECAQEQFEHWGKPGVLQLSGEVSNTRVVRLLLQRLIDQGMHIVQAVGETEDYNESGIDQCNDDTNIRIDGKIDVGGWELENDRYPPSNWGDCVDVYAPAHIVIAANYKRLVDGEGEMTFGTSHAAAHVVGALALVLADNPNLSPKELKARVLASARSARDTELREDVKVLQLKGLV